MTQSWSAETFERLYARNPDPWGFETSDYERQKYAATLDAIGERRFAAGLEVGCSIGVLTKLLASRCEALLAVDFSEAALRFAGVRLADVAGVRLERRRIPDEWPQGSFDLILLSEILYFLSPEDVVRTAQCASASLRPGGLAVLVNWTGPTDTPSTGDGAATLFLEQTAASLPAERRMDGASWRLDVLRAV